MASTTNTDPKTPATTPEMEKIEAVERTIRAEHPLVWEAFSDGLDPEFLTRHGTVERDRSGRWHVACDEDELFYETDGVCSHAGPFESREEAERLLDAIHAVPVALMEAW